jgi:hypothetical protein
MESVCLSQGISFEDDNEHCESNCNNSKQEAKQARFGGKTKWTCRGRTVLMVKFDNPKKIKRM